MGIRQVVRGIDEKSTVTGDVVQLLTPPRPEGRVSATYGVQPRAELSTRRQPLEGTQTAVFGL